MRRWTWLWVAAVVVGVVLLVVAAVAALASPRKQVHPLDPSTAETPVGTPTGEDARLPWSGTARQPSPYDTVPLRSYRS